MIQQRSSSSLYCSRPLWAAPAWAGMSTLCCRPSSIFSADHSVAPPPRCSEGWFWHTSLRLLPVARRGSHLSLLLFRQIVCIWTLHFTAVPLLSLPDVALFLLWMFGFHKERKSSGQFLHNGVTEREKEREGERERESWCSKNKAVNCMNWIVVCRFWLTWRNKIQPSFWQWSIQSKTNKQVLVWPLLQNA